MMRALAACFSGIVGCVTSALADAPDTQARADAAVAFYKDWLADNDATGVIALVRGGELVRLHGVGRDAHAAIELGAISQSITSICASELVADGVMAWSDTLRDRLNVDLDVTLEQLVTHQSGLIDDSTQSLMWWRVGMVSEDQSANVLAAVSALGPDGHVGKLAFNGENFALTGLMIEAATGRAYLDVCHEFAVAPAGVTASPSPDTGAFLSWSGWQMHPGDLALWHAHWFSGDSVLAQDPKSAPFATVKDDVFWGSGAQFVSYPQGNIFMQPATLCFPARLSTGSIVLTLFGDWTIVVSWDTCPDPFEVLDLQKFIVLPFREVAR